MLWNYIRGFGFSLLMGLFVYVALNMAFYYHDLININLCRGQPQQWRPSGRKLSALVGQELMNRLGDVVLKS